LLWKNKEKRTMRKVGLVYYGRAQTKEKPYCGIIEKKDYNGPLHLDWFEKCRIALLSD
jgi:hypothetical protein